MRLPLFWQLESPLHTAAKASHATFFINEQENMPVGAEAIRTAGLDTVLTDTSDALVFATYLSEKGKLMPKNWFMVHPVFEPSWNIHAVLRGKNYRVAQEVHIFPGVPFLEQCVFLYEKKEPIFHVCDTFTVEFGKNRTIAKSTKRDILTLWKYELPCLLKEKETCKCGKTIISKI